MNFKHLHYFWATAKAGGIMKASEQLHITPQTLSGQIKLLEDQLGCQLFRKHGRRLELTDAGRIALSYAEQIFTLSAEMEKMLEHARPAQPIVDCRVGIADSVPKVIAYRLLEPALEILQPVRLFCHEGKFEDLLAQLAVHKLELVLADEPFSKQLSVKAFNHALGDTAMSFFAAPSLQTKLQGPFPHCLQGAPMLLPGRTSAVRQKLELWLAQHQIHIQVVGEFDDAALLKAFGREGRGIFMSPTVLQAEICSQYSVQAIGMTADIVEEFFAVSIERRITHPCVAAITAAARGQLFNAQPITEPS